MPLAFSAYNRTKIFKQVATLTYHALPNMRFLVVSAFIELFLAFAKC